MGYDIYVWGQKSYRNKETYHVAVYSDARVCKYASAASINRLQRKAEGKNPFIGNIHPSPPPTWRISRTSSLDTREQHRVLRALGGN